LTPEIFEKSLRDQLTIIKMKRMITSPIDKRLYEDEKTANEVAEAAVKSYVDAVKQRMKIKINMELIS
jgi:hypothetical protein